MQALRVLLQEKDFNSITTAEISRVSGVNEALIYRYFKDKRGLLHQVLAEYLRGMLTHLAKELEQAHGVFSKLTSLIRATLSFYDTDRVFSKILLLEVRNYPGYFDSDPYELVKVYGRLIREIIEEGIRNREIRDGISPSRIRDLILGGVEHACLPAIIFDRELDVEAITKDLTVLLFEGLTKR